MQGEVCTWQNSIRAKATQKFSQGTAKLCAKFGWPPVNDVAAVTKPKR